MRIECQAVLFDLDGVLVDSAAQITRIWRCWAEVHSLPPEPVTALALTTRTEEVVRRFAPHLDLASETQYLEDEESSDLDGLTATPGALCLVQALPARAWAVVTAVGAQAALAKLGAAGLPAPQLLVAGDMVSRGKPDPQGYLLAAQRIGAPPGECIVFEDSPAGLQAARAAGMTPVALATTHTPGELSLAHTLLHDLRGVKLEGIHPKSTCLTLILRGSTHKDNYPTHTVP